MPAPMIWLRLEIADNQVFEGFPDFSYEAAHVTSIKKYQHKSSFAKVVAAGAQGDLQHGACNLPTDKDLELHRGRRAFGPIKLEIYHVADVKMNASDKSEVDDDLTTPNAVLELGYQALAKLTVSEKSEAKDDQNVLSGRPSLQPLLTSMSAVDTAASTQTSSAMCRAPPLDHINADDVADREDKVSKVTAMKDLPRDEAGAATADAIERQCLGQEAATWQASIDREEVKDAHGSRPTSAKGRGHSHSPTLVQPSSITFFSGNPSVEITEGIMHLYKQDKEEHKQMPEERQQSEMVCILTVPASIMSQELLHFIAPVQPHLESIRVVRDSTPNQYMVLLKFRTQKHAEEFFNSYNHQPFNSIEPDICQLVYVARLETAKSSEGAGLPMPGWTELPACPVCLERMDESVDGILTVLCNHSFHTSCLVRWQDTSCPVCRYVQTPEAVADNNCLNCGAQESLWICLICGHVGCGRYLEGHAFRHFQETNHTYAMQLGRDRVWDYAGDNYVHRLVQNKGDGKLVEVDEGGNVVQEEKLDSIMLEYTYLLTSQLESQRRYFEEKIEHIEKEAFKLVEEANAKSSKSLAEVERLGHALATTQKEKQCVEKKIASLSGRMHKMQQELQDEREMNRSLQSNQALWQSKVQTLEHKLETKEAEINEQQDHLRDVMFFLDAQQKLASTDSVSQQEIQEGQIVVETPSASGGGKKSRKKTR